VNQPRKNPIHIETLRQQIARLERPAARGGGTPIPSGCGPLDRLLPGGGFRRGTLAEWLSAGEGSGAATLALAVARRACQEGGALVVLDRSREFYPPAAVRLGIQPENLIVVQAGSEADHRWALDQALRCVGVAAVLAWPEKLDGRTFRRLQLAAEEGGGLGLLIRPPAARGEPSWADVRLLVEPLPAEPWPSPKRRLRIHLLRCRGGANGRHVDLEIDDETHPVHLAARLADPAACADAAGA
jgi:protein ImuA